MIGLLVVIFGGATGRQYMMPGKLSTHHAGLIDCSSCHAGAGLGRVDLLHRFVTAVTPRQNSNLCLACHDMGAQARAPHTHPVDDLRRLTELLRSETKGASTESWMQRLTYSAPAKSPSGEPEVQCSTCHEEHEGVLHDLRAVSNERCQSCHVSKLGSFADSHPQFSNYPNERRTRIVFDHQSHMGKYFPDAVKAAIPGQVAPNDCSDCHLPGVRQKYMAVKSFNPMCSGCHNGDITGATRVSGTKGIDFITVPGLDLETLNERGIDIGGWPKGSEATLTPFMRLLLESNGEHIVSDVTGLDLLDLSKASDGELARVAALAWAVKRLFGRLQNAQLAAAMAVSGDDSEKRIVRLQMAALTGGMSHDVIMGGSREWFPDLQDDLERHDHGDPTRDFKPPEKPPAEVAKPSLPAPGGGSPGSPTAAGTAPSDDILASGNDAGGDKNSILAPDNKSDILAPDKPSDDNILSLGGGDAGLGDAKPGKSDAKNGAEASASANPAAKPFDPEIWAQDGGWYRQDFTIRYRPSGHDDRFLQTWLDYAGAAAGDAKLHDQLTPIFEELAPKDAVGRCTKCHSVDDESGGAKIVNWQPFDPNSRKSRFTNFSHQPHIEKDAAKTCVKCHELGQTESQYLKTYEGGDPAMFVSNFKPLQKSVCADCHSQQASWENCTLCHGYHVREPIADRNRLLRSSSLP